MTHAKSASVAPEEIARFAAQADEWWKPEGAFRMLHKLGPLRVDYIEKQVCAHFRREGGKTNSLQGTRILDVGCGGGLLAEAMARRGAKVTGIDPSPESIDVARRHAQTSNLAIDYRTGTIEALSTGKQRYDVITALEIVEHVANLESFLKSLARLLKPNGLLILATLNRTPRSFLFGVVAAEYLLNWVPAGTHDWAKFRRPSELVSKLEALDLAPVDLCGVVFDPLTGVFDLNAHNLKVNYLLTASKREDGTNYFQQG